MPASRGLPFSPSVTLGLSQSGREIRITGLPAADGGNMDAGRCGCLANGCSFDASSQDRMYGFRAPFHVDTANPH
jgi:hypothetical protein